MAGWPKISLNTEDGYRMCFCCGRDNPIGLKLSFQWDGKHARAEFVPTELYQGWSGTVHGGIITCLLDEAMSYAPLFENMYCVTAKMEIKLKRQAVIGEPLIITSSIVKKSRKLVKTKAAVTMKDGTLIAESTATHFVTDNKEGKD